jgi:hypothetical protein
MFTYQLLFDHNRNELSPVVLRIEDNTFIPHDTENMDYLAYLEWLDEGNTPLPPADQEADPA